MRTKNLAILASILLAIGCDNGNGGGDAGPGDGGTPTPDACTSCTEDGGHTTPDSGPEEDGNDSFATATDITVGATDPTSGVINPPGDLDYYTFDGTEGDWIVITTDANPDDNPDMLDTVITLYDASMNKIAENDDSLPRFDTDSELITRLPATGTYYVLVQEWSTWDGSGPDEGMASFTYDLRVGKFNPAAAGVNIDAEGGNDAATAQALTEQTGTMGGGISYILGTFADASDVDVYSFSLTNAASFSVNLIPGGDTGDGAAANPARIYVTNSDGTETIASLTPNDFDPLGSGENVEVNPSLPPGDYLLFVEGAASADFYAIKALHYGENPEEMHEDTNGEIGLSGETGMAEALTAATGTRNYYLLAHLPYDSAAITADVDFYSFEVTAGEQVNVFCASASNGSGVQGLSAALIGSDMTTAITAAPVTESVTDGLAIQNQAVPAAGTYYLKLTSTGQSDTVTGDWVRCGIALRVPGA